MSRSMYRYVVPIDDEPHVFALRGNPVAVAVQGDAGPVEFWAEHDPSRSAFDQAFQVFGTGQPLPEKAEWAGTCPRTPLGLVWHLYEVSIP